MRIRKLEKVGFAENSKLFRVTYDTTWRKGVIRDVVVTQRERYNNYNWADTGECEYVNQELLDHFLESDKIMLEIEGR